MGKWNFDDDLGGTFVEVRDGDTVPEPALPPDQRDQDTDESEPVKPTDD